MFLTQLEDFWYMPHLKGDLIQRGEVQLKSTLLWRPEDKADVVVPEGFVTDLASLLWSGLLLTKLGRHQRAAVLHDWLYRNKIQNKRWSDQQFKLAMQQDNVAAWRIHIIMAGLYIFGWISWNKPAEVVIN